MPRPDISSHWSNDDDRHYRFARRADPPWYPERGWHPDGYVAVATVILAIVGFIAAWYNAA